MPIDLGGDGVYVQAMFGRKSPTKSDSEATPATEASAAEDLRNRIRAIELPALGEQTTQVVGDSLQVCRVVGEKLMVLISLDEMENPSDAVVHGLRNRLAKMLPAWAQEGLVPAGVTLELATTGSSKPAPPSAPQAPARPPPPAEKLVGVKTVVLVASGKGGVGKSTIAAHLAIRLAKQGLTTGLLDCDIYGPSMPIQFPAPDGQPLPKPLVDEASGKLIPHLMPPYNLRLVSMGFLVRGATSVVWRGPMLMKALRQFFFDVTWGTAADPLDVLVCDMPPGTGDVPLTIAQAVDVPKHAIVVTTPQPIAHIDAKKAVDMFQKMDIPVLGIVDNMASYVCGECDTIHHPFGKPGVLAAELELPQLAILPLCDTLGTGNSDGIPYTPVDAIAEQQFAQLADAIMPKILAMSGKQAQ